MPSVSVDPTAAAEVLKRHGARKIAYCGATGDVPEDSDGVVVVDPAAFRVLMRTLEPLSRRDCLILPASRDWVVPEDLRQGDAMFSAWRTTSAANYAARCNLKGHYLEFGTFWGSSFFPNYFRLRHWLRGSFFAFDSFRGLSRPEGRETLFTGGDFQEGAYCSNQRSFVALADFLEVPADRLTVVPGFYHETLAGVSPDNTGWKTGPFPSVTLIATFESQRSKSSISSRLFWRTAP